MPSNSTAAIEPPPDHQLPASFLARLQVACGNAPEASLEGAIHAAEGGLGARADSWPMALRAAFAPSGFLLNEVALDPEGALRSVRSGAPFVTWTPEGGWLAILEAVGDRARVIHADGRDEWQSVAALRDAVGPSPQWMSIESGLGAGSPGSGGTARPFARLMAIVRLESSDVLAVVLYSAFIGLLMLAVPIAVQQLVNTVAFGGLVQPVVVLALLLLVGLTIAAGLSAFQAYLAEVLQRRIFVRACADLANRLPRVAVDAYGGDASPAFVNRFFDLVTLQKTGARLLLEGSSVLLQTMVGLLILSFYHPLMLALSGVLIATMGVVAFVFGRGASPTAQRESSAKYALAGWMEELVRHRTAFRNSSGRAHASRRADLLATTWVAARRQHYRIVFRQFVAALGLQVAVNTLVLALGGFLVVSGELTLGQLVASEIIVAAVVSAFARLAKHFESFYDLLAAVDKVGSLLDLPIERASGRWPSSSEPRPAGFAVRDVTHSPSGRSLFRGLSFEVEAGERVALIGPAASGKSILLDFVGGLCAPDSGYLMLDGEDLRELAPQTTRDRVAIVRDPELLPATVAENLRVSRASASEREIRDALASVGLLEDVRSLPQGIETTLGIDGAPLSRSQLARLALARAILSQPRVLILDDALVHLDTDSLKPVLETLFDNDALWTLVIVSRDDSILSRCDRVLRIEAGRIVETPRDVDSTEPEARS